MENGFDKYAHVSMSRVLSTNNAESQPLQGLHPSISQNSLTGMDEWTLKADPAKMETEQQRKKMGVRFTQHKHSVAEGA